MQKVEALFENDYTALLWRNMDYIQHEALENSFDLTPLIRQILNDFWSKNSLSPKVCIGGVALIDS